MIQMQQIKLSPLQCATEAQTKENLIRKCARLLRVSPEEIKAVTICKKSLDARKKPRVFYVFTAAVSLSGTAERRALANRKQTGAAAYEKKVYRFPDTGAENMRHRPVIVGTGPAGLFCGYYLAAHGYMPILLERGQAVERRRRDVEDFWRSGTLRPESNVQFGEGGAGTFSDGKLNTLVRDVSGRNGEVLRCFVENGAKPEILYESKPHLGTDALTGIVRHMRKAILANGGEVRFGACVTDVLQRDGRVCGVRINGESMLETETLVLAIGHSARDTFFALEKAGVRMERKPFAVGVRIEHPQKWINDSQYGADSPYTLPPAAYKLTARAKDGRGVYSFCMCPGGYVVNASSEPGRLAVNGMSYAKRDGVNANSAIVAAVAADEFDLLCRELQAGAAQTEALPPVLAGVALQRLLEERAYRAGGGRIPVQRLADFTENRATLAAGKILPQTKGAWSFGDVRGIFPRTLACALDEGIAVCGGKLCGFADGDALLAGVESRTSSPVRIVRGAALEGSLAGLYPCGEGAGYAGGITSAAMDGIRVAEAIARIYAPLA